MTRRKFRADVATAAAASIKGISAVDLGPDDGEVNCIYTNTQHVFHLPLRLTTVSVDDYPRHQGFHGSTESNNIHGKILDVLSNLVDSTEGKPVVDSFAILSYQLDKALETLHSEQSPDEDVLMVDVDDDDDGADFGYDDEEEGDTDVEFEDYDLEIHDNISFGLTSDSVATSTQQQIKSNARLMEDLTKARRAGFRIGLWPNDNIFSLSLRVSKLGLPEETLTAWQIDPTDYIILLCKYEEHYYPLEVFATLQGGGKPVRFRIGKCKSYKPNAATTRAAFNRRDQQAATAKEDGDNNDVFDRLYVSNSLDLWMEQEFAALLMLRIQRKVSWDRAKLVFLALSKSDHFRTPMSDLEPEDSSEEVEALVSPMAPCKLNRDYLFQNPEPAASDSSESVNKSAFNKERSLPLVAMQFVLRYFAKSTQYCMVCHLKTSEDFAAIKPYVCNDPLCLYQYMSLGFGPSIEHEIINQPLVVDLLISFFMVSLQQDKLREYPVGLNLLIPMPDSLKTTDAQGATGGNSNQCTVNFQQRVIFRSKKDGTLDEAVTSLKPGDVFILARVAALALTSGFNHYHCIVLSIDFAVGTIAFECFTETSSISTPHESRASTEGLIDPSILEDVEEEYVIHRFEHELSELDHSQRRTSLALILGSLPAVAVMRKHLIGKPNATIDNCPRVSKPSLALLRWIIASNRSMIVQIDSAADSPVDGASSQAKDKLSGIPGRWAQFRFAQGSPEKEQRLMRAVMANSSTKPAPTIFAWHGSPLGNWHSIIRQGLDFSKISNGRAYGNGVYFSPEWGTGCGYAGQRSNGPMHGWPRSQLQPSAVVSLCEIVNRPEAFVSAAPHYVVKDLDWIQCRYLLVQTTAAPASQQGRDVELVSAAPDTVLLEQDPQYAVYGPATAASVQPHTVQVPSRFGTHYSGSMVGIPNAASPVARLRQQSARSTTEGMLIDDDESSTEDCDLKLQLMRHAPVIEEIVHNDTELSSADGLILDSSKTDFYPGTVDIGSLPKLPAPTWATDSGRKALGRELKKLQKVQATTPLHELGWYVDFDNIDNLFHWIVELHSFDPKLPLAQDMQSMDVRSIVLEVRFGRSFPLSPPFVRVIWPRFLPFLSGGGGHVTAGGAMCMELLTNSGWSPVASIEIVLLQVRIAMCSNDPRPAKLELSPVHRGKVKDYGIDEAIAAFKRSASAHGWTVPPDLEETARAR
ncbi:hypothetical protein ACHAQH_006466 [Verticillium albo-atrum]